jgi:amino acid permease
MISAPIKVAFSPLQVADSDREDESSRISDVLASGDEQGPHDGLSSTETIIAIVKCALGAGSFTLPHAFMNGGLVFSCIGTVFIGTISGITLHMLAICESEIHQKFELLKNRSLTYSDLAAYAFPKLYVTMCGGVQINALSFLTLCGIIFTSIGVSAVYMSFIITVTGEILASRGVHVTSGSIALIISPFILGLLWLQDYKLLARLSAFGNISVFAGCFAVIIYGLQHPKLNGSPYIVFTTLKPTDSSSFFGSVSFLFAIHVVMLPILQKMRFRSHVKEIIRNSYFLITSANIIFAVSALILFFNAYCMNSEGIQDEASGPCGNILDNLSNGPTLVTIKIFICIDLLLTIPLVMSAAREILEENIISCFALSSHMRIVSFRYLFRTFLCTVSILFALNVSGFSQIVSKVGGIICSFAGYILPPSIYLKTMWNKLTIFEKIISLLIIAFGSALLASVSISASS